MKKTLLFSFLAVTLLLCIDVKACDGILDILCNLRIGSSGKATVNIGSATKNSVSPLIPVRQFLRYKDIPPPDAGAYGLVVFRSRPTDANRAKYNMICQSFIASFPRNETSNVPVEDQMVTVWPVDDPEADQAKKDDCKFVLEHYDLNASETAIRDAYLQHASLNGERDLI